MKPLGLDTLPISTKCDLPLRPKLFVLRHDVFDRVILDGHAFLPAVVFQPPKPVAALRNAYRSRVRNTRSNSLSRGNRRYDGMVKKVARILSNS